MISSYNPRRQNTPLIIMAAIASVLACILIWYFTSQGLETVLAPTPTPSNTPLDPTNPFPTIDLGPPPTDVPECQYFEVEVSSALLRECPSELCDIRESRDYEEQVCVYGRAENSEDYPFALEWYVVDLNADGAFRDLAYMHNSVIRPANPTLRPSRTFTPLQTITPTPTFTQPPTRQPITQPTAQSPSPSPSPTEFIPPSPTPTLARPEL